MKLPSDYLKFVTGGTHALRAIGQALRTAAAQDPTTPELWLSIRDVEILADRLASLTDEEWRRGDAILFVTGQDVGVVEELIMNPAVVAGGVPDDRIAALARLHDFLRQYCDGEFEREDRAGQ